MIWPDLNGVAALPLRGGRAVRCAGRPARLLAAGGRLEAPLGLPMGKSDGIQLLDIRVWMMPIFPWRAEMLKKTWNREGGRFHELWMPEFHRYEQYIETLKQRTDAQELLSSPLRLELGQQVVREEEVHLPGYFWPVWQMTVPTSAAGRANLAISLRRRNPVPYALAVASILVRPWSVAQLEILRCPPIVRTGRPFTVLVACRPGTRVSVNSLAPELEFTGENAGVESWTRELRFVAKRAGASLNLNLGANGRRRQVVIARAVDLPDDGLKIGVELADYSSAEIERCLSWLHQEQIGNYAALGLQCPAFNGDLRVSAPALQNLAERARRDGIYFNDIYGEVPRAARRKAGRYALARQRHEWDGILYAGWFDFSTKDVPENLPAAQSWWLKHIRQNAPRGTRFSGPSATHRYFAQAGASWIGHEGLYGSLDIGLAHERGVARAYGLAEYGVHLAHQWYSYPHDDPAKIRRLRVALLLSYLYGAHNIYVENGTLRVMFQDRFEHDHPAMQACLDVHRTFYRFALSHARVGEAEVRLGFVQGLYDSWDGCFDTQVWGQRGRGLGWESGWPERSWELLTAIYPLARTGTLEMLADEPLREPTGWFSTDPYGEVDLVPVEAPLSGLQRYKQLIFLGWNTMTNTTYATLCQYVRGGGHLLLWLPHMTTQLRRDEPWRPFRGGSWEDLLGLRCGEYDPRPVLGIAEQDAAANLTGESGFLPVLRRNLTLVGARPLAWKIENKAWNIEKDPILTEHRLGQGIAWFVNLDCYPGFSGVSSWARTLLTRLALQARPAVHLETEGPLHWVSWLDPQSGLRRVYVLNIDWWSGSDRASRGWIASGSWKIPISVPPGVLTVTTMTDDLAIVPDDPQTYIERISGDGRGTRVTLQTGPGRAIRVFSRNGFSKRMAVQPFARVRSVEGGGIRVEIRRGGRQTLAFKL